MEESQDVMTKRKNSGPTFIDLFAGIGGFRWALEKTLKGTCVFASEWDKFAQLTYEANFGHKPSGDITAISPTKIPDHDILTAGFPCQPFSIAGVSKNNALGRLHGFAHATQGTLFFNVAKIIEAKQPRAFILENVKNLKSHDKGRTFAVITEALKELGYHFESRVIDAKHWVPQHRERIFFVGFRDEEELRRFSWPTPPEGGPKFASILEKKVDPKYTLTDGLWTYLQAYSAKHKAAGNGFGYGMTDLKGISRTLSARYYKDGSEVLIPQKGNKNPRRLTPRECARLMGYPEEMEIVCSDTRAYKQFGNSVAVPVVTAICTQVVKAFDLRTVPMGKAPQLDLFGGRAEIVSRVA
ncbi:MAG: DNA (cytosine-5-)-methyltransferase [Archangium sp.]|nr:DNA (cytosine-5-)-methyltransferase [Archangium sp.]MDP3570696.1 DNA (cytosine-5-)-methyltransferase [Archangium sp.]